MAKAAVSVTGVSARNAQVNVSYSVAVDDGSLFSGNYRVDFAVAASTNMTNLRNQIITQAGQRGVTLLSTDVYLFGVL